MRIHLDTIQECDGWTDRQICHNGIVLGKSACISMLMRDRIERKAYSTCTGAHIVNCKHTNTHNTHMFNGHCHKTAWVRHYQNVEPFWVLMEQDGGTDDGSDSWNSE